MTYTHSAVQWQRQSRLGTCSSVLTIIACVGVFCCAPVQAADTVQAALAHAGRSAADRERDERSRPAAVLTFMGVRPGMQVADLFAGGGYYSEILAHVVGPRGRVIAHNNGVYAEFAGDELRGRLAGKRLPNVVALESEFNNLRLGTGKLDMILMVMSYHDIYWVNDMWPQPGRDYFFAQLRRALKPGGILAIVDHAAEPGTRTSAVSTLHRIDPEFARADLEEAGFRFTGSADVLQNPDDDRSLSVFDDAIRGRTDRFVYRFVKP